MVPHWPVALNPERRARVAAAVPLLGELLELGVLRRHVDLDRHELVAALAVLGRKAAALEPEHLARGRALRDREHDRPFGRRHLDLGAEHRLLERDRKLHANVRALALEEAVRSDLDRDDRVAAPAGSLLPLAGKPDPRSILETRRKFEV